MLNAIQNMDRTMLAESITKDVEVMAKERDPTKTITVTKETPR